MTGAATGNGLSVFALINAAVFILFAFSFFRPQTPHDGRSRGAFGAFLVALFVMMHGFSLAIFLLPGWLQTRIPGIDWFAQDAGHPSEMMFGSGGNSHFGPFHPASFWLIGAGFWLISAAWPVLYAAQRSGRLAASGVHARLRHPPYAGIVLFLTGLLVQVPTPLARAMYPFLIRMYARLARAEERETGARFGTAPDDGARRVPACFPGYRSEPLNAH